MDQESIKKIIEIAFVVIIVLGALSKTIISAYAKKWFNMIFWIFLGTAFGLFELVGETWFGGTISEHNREIALSYPALGWIDAFISFTLFVALAWHLAWDYGVKRLIIKKK